MSSAPPARRAPSAPPRRSGPDTNRGPARAASIDPIRVLRRHMLLIIASAILGSVIGVVAFFALMRFYPLYRAEVFFEVRPGLRDSQDIGANDFANDDAVFRLAKTETYLLTSRDVLQKAVERPEIRQTTWHRRYVGDDGVFSVQDAIDELEEYVGTTVVRDSHLFGLHWSIHDKDDVPIVLNAIARSYLDKRTTQDSAVYNDNLSVFQSQLSQTNRDLEDLSRDISAFIRERSITTLDDTRFSQEAKKAEEITEQLSEFTTSLSGLMTAQRQVLAKITGSLKPSSEDYVEAEQHSSVVLQARELQELKTQLRARLMNFQPDHPEIILLQDRVDATDLALREKVDEIVRQQLEAQKTTFDKEIERVNGMIASLDSELDTAEANLRELAADQSRFEAMESRRGLLEDRRESQLQLINQAQLMKMRADASRIRMAQPALTPREPSFPKLEIMIPLGALLCIAITVGTVFLRELTDQRVKGSSDLAVIPGAELLGVIPELEEDPTDADAAELAVHRHPQSVLAESYRQAATSLTLISEHTGYQSFLLAGGMPGAGSTTAVTNLATAVAASGRRVIAIDANFRRPRLAEAMGVASDGPGFGDVICGAASLEDTVHDTEFGVAVIGAGQAENRIFERLGNGTVQEILAQLRSRYDLILFDAPPAVVAGDAMVLANSVDAAVLIVRANQEQRGLVARLISQFRNARCELVGILLNRPRNTAGGYFKKNYAAMADYAVRDSA